MRQELIEGFPAVPDVEHLKLPVFAEARVQPHRAFRCAELAETIERATSALPSELREVLILRETEDMSYDQMAEIIGCPLGTVRSRLNTARQRLQRVVLEWLGDTQR